MTNQEKQADEILVLQSIFDRKCRLIDDHQYEILIEFELITPITIQWNNQISTIQYLPPFSLIIHYHNEYPSEVCVYDSIDLLKHEIPNEWIFHPTFSEQKNDPRALNGYTIETAEKIFQYLIHYNQEHLDKQFQNQLQTCFICIDVLPGMECIRLRRCEHFYCRLCLNNYIQMTLNNGQFGEKLHCPENPCQ